MIERFDAIVIGAGHNGLVCSALLARAGKRVLVVEANGQVGGAAVTREFAEGFSVSACAHLLYQLQPEVRKELNLATRLASEDMTTIALGKDGAHIRLRGADVEGVADDDRAAYRQFRDRAIRFAGVLRGLFNRKPPRLVAGDLSEIAALARFGVQLRLLGRNEMRTFLRLIGINIHDEVTERFASPLLRGAVSLDAVLGTHLGPRSPNTYLTYLHRHAGDCGRHGIPAGGMGSVSNELAQAARSAGVVIRTNTPVKRIVISNGRASGVETETGELFESLLVVSNADPRSTVMQLVGPQNVETGFARRVSHLRASGNAAKLHLALHGLPSIAGLERRDLAERIVIAGDERAVERAFNPAKYGEYSATPVFEITFPSIRDETLAPAGKHVMSAVVQYAPYALQGGWDDDAKQRFLQRCLEVLGEYMPDLSTRIVASELLTPVDLEREFHMTGGHWHHAELVLDQFLSVRPVNGASQYRLPVDGVWLCGAGSHPGGGVSGAAGRNAARAILRRERIS